MKIQWYFFWNFFLARFVLFNTYIMVATRIWLFKLKICKINILSCTGFVSSMLATYKWSLECTVLI